MNGFRHRADRAFTFVELMIVIVIVGILTALSIPDGDARAEIQGRRAAETLEGDVAYARSLSIARPDDPVVIRFDVANNKYWLARRSTPTTPISHPTRNTSYVVQFGSNGNPGLTEVSLVAVDLDGDEILEFDALGGIDQDTAAIIQLATSTSQYEVTVEPVAAKSTSSDSFSTDLIGA